MCVCLKVFINDLKFGEIYIFLRFQSFINQQSFAKNKK